MQGSFADRRDTGTFPNPHLWHRHRAWWPGEASHSKKYRHYRLNGNWQPTEKRKTLFLVWVKRMQDESHCSEFQGESHFTIWWCECEGQTEPALQRFAGNSAAGTADFFEQELRPGVRELSSSRSWDVTMLLWQVQMPEKHENWQLCHWARVIVGHGGMACFLRRSHWNFTEARSDVSQVEQRLHQARHSRSCPGFRGLSDFFEHVWT